MKDREPRIQPPEEVAGDIEHASSFMSMNRITTIFMKWKPDFMKWLYEYFCLKKGEKKTQKITSSEMSASFERQLTEPEIYQHD